MLQEGTKVKAPNGDIGIIKSVNEGGGLFARGYFVKFEDGSLFMREASVDPIIEMKETSEGQMMMNI